MFTHYLRYLLVISFASIGLLYWLSRRQGRLPSWLVLLPGLVVIGAMAIVVSTQVDDAYITYRYAHNFAAGHGPVYNPGERVEGYTSPLWLLLLTGGLIVGIPPTTFAPVLAGVLLIVLVLLVDRILVHHGVRSVWLRGLLPITLGQSPAFVLWWFSGLEAPACAVVMLAICWQLSQLDLSDRKAMAALGVLVALAVMIRPDGLLMAVVVVAYLLNNSLQTVQTRRIRSVVYLLGPVAAVVGALTILRLLYYGQWLPNTYYCKLGGAGFSHFTQGVLYVVDNVKYLGGTAPLIVAAIGVVWARPKDFMKWAAVTVLLYIGFFLYTGGDSMQRRFFAHISPLLYVMVWIGAVAVAGRLAAATEKGRLTAYLTGVVLVLLFVPTIAETPRYLGSRRIESRRHDVAAVITENIPRDFEMAIGPAGIVPYVTGMPTIDMLGLCDAYIARLQPKPGFYRPPEVGGPLRGRARP